MVNVIGSTPDPASLAGVPGAHLHLYGKKPRSGRKLGHITLLSEHGETPAIEALRDVGIEVP